ncbi:hypothetical protein LTR10_022721 [Elasticomyces elasticus]|uniref:Glutamine amidotransferase type-2 domain-containing protein n=1 Tax=Exophiala sideris TaxID=1016849 RepID=A0ABR0IVJ0_9EURO|nr:hypothetical protein LTR10_022721 [Elasticomyces elasticus]KAK5021491.1 hypothetical protein LTS07_011000 [Exophiala sideris]KAK5024486.1 hypothetical protein LTR13_010847 [Exophiala sideris]KAK5049623.1 hypothetical protein LTR69_011024 [Exophiala sideris]KAK5176582.1 hypothetical protein LTR44_010868 [Eurotiomycetes sp. CCFEE 6388]
MTDAWVQNNSMYSSHPYADNLALGHVRLDINDLSPAGCQPLHSSDNSVHTVVNGEIYDYDKLRLDMEQKIDYKFQGTSDSELVLALYKYYGLSFLSHIRGEFSICLFDSERELFMAVRDRYGIKPLFWTVQDGELLVAAEVKAFLPLGWKPEWDVKSIVGGDFQIGNSTIFKRVKKVRWELCHAWIIVDVSRCFGTIHEQQYWDSRYPDKVTGRCSPNMKNIEEARSEQEMIQGVQDRLVDAVKVRLRADVKVGVSLSGGIDSSVVAGIVNHLLRQGHQIGSEAENERLSCFGIAFDEDSGFDESSMASRTAEYLGVKFYKKHMNEEELARSFADATWHDEQPNPDLNFIGTYALSELFRDKGFRVNINGQGADEIFAGYNIFLPDFLREPDTAFGGPTIPEDERLAELRKAEETLNRVYQSKLDLDGTSVARRQLNNTLTPVQMTAAFPPLPVKEDFLPANNVVDPQLTYAENIDGMMLEEVNRKWHPLHTALYCFTKAHLQNLLLSNLGDRGEMAHSIEGRTPFLDHHLAEYVNNLPPSMKIRHDEKGEWVEKYVLREAAKPFITEEIYKKRKHPYSAPVEFPKNGPMHQLLQTLVTKHNIAKLGFLESEGVEDLVDQVFETKEMPTFRLVICLAQWVVLQQRFGVVKAQSEIEQLDAENLKVGSNVMLG